MKKRESLMEQIMEGDQEREEIFVRRTMLLLLRNKRSLLWHQMKKDMRRWKKERIFLYTCKCIRSCFAERKRDIPQDAVSAVITGAEIYMPLEELIDFEKEIQRLQKEKEKLEKELQRVNGKLSNQGFWQKHLKESLKKKEKNEPIMRMMMQKLPRD